MLHQRLSSRLFSLPATFWLAFSLLTSPPVAARSLLDVFRGDNPVQRAETLSRSGDFAQAADLFLAAADDADGEEQQGERAHLLLRAAECAEQAQRNELATQTLSRINLEALNSELQMRAVLVRANLGQYETRPLSLLEDLPAPALRMPLWVSTRIWKARADAFFKLDRAGEGVHALVQRELGLLDERAIQANHDLIWRALARSLPKTRDDKESARYDSITRGWLDLATIMNTYWLGPDQLTRAIAGWQQRYPAHPANDSILAHKTQTLATARHTPAATTPAYSRDGQYDTYALFLPLSGPLALPAAAVRDGFFAALYSKPVPRPNVLVYDTGAAGTDMGVLLQRALTARADLIVGPLAKEQVAALAAQQPPVPVLSLNYLDNYQTANNTVTTADFYQFGLLPEDEAQQAAQRAIADGRRNALVLAPEGEWGNRMLAAFRDTLQALGGTVVDARIYKNNTGHISAVVPELLKYDGKLARLLEQQARDPKATPPAPGTATSPIRSDADFIFIASQPQHARQIVPQLRYFRAGSLPLYGTSHLYTGREDPNSDTDLDGLIFCDMPWLLQKPTGSQGVRASIATLWPRTAQPLARLYALGYDAYQLADNLQVSRLDPAKTWPAATGGLQPQAGGRLRRHLMWAQFKNGKPAPLAATSANSDAQDSNPAVP